MPSEATPGSEADVSTSKITGDLQTIHVGTGLETYCLVTKTLAGLGIPNWEEKLSAPQVADNGERKITLFAFGTDAGPDNIGMCGRVRRALLLCELVMFIWKFRLFHQGHLASKCIIKALDNWTWPAECPEAQLPTTFFNGISAITNLWRGPGHPRKIKAAAVKEFSHSVAERFFSHTPGRCLRGRWLSCEAVVSRVRDTVHYIGPIF